MANVDTDIISKIFYTKIFILNCVLLRKNQNDIHILSVKNKDLFYLLIQRLMND